MAVGRVEPSDQTWTYRQSRQPNYTTKKKSYIDKDNSLSFSSTKFIFRSNPTPKSPTTNGTRLQHGYHSKRTRKGETRHSHANHRGYRQKGVVEKQDEGEKPVDYIQPVAETDLIPDTDKTWNEGVRLGWRGEIQALKAFPTPDKSATPVIHIPCVRASEKTKNGHNVL